MGTLINKKRIMILFLIMVSLGSFYYAYKKFKINRPISAKLVFDVYTTDLWRGSNGA